MMVGDRPDEEGEKGKGKGKEKKQKDPPSTKEGEELIMFRSRPRTQEWIDGYRRREENKVQEAARRTEAAARKKRPAAKLHRHDPYAANRGVIPRALRQLTSGDRRQTAEPDESQASASAECSSHTAQPKPDLPKHTRNPALILSVYRNDLQGLTFENALDLDQIIIEAELTHGRANNYIMPFNILSSIKKGESQDLEASSPEGLAFYINAVNAIDYTDDDHIGHPGYTAHPPGSKPTDRRIWGTIHRVHWKQRAHIHECFAYGTGGAVRPTQVEQYKPAAVDPSAMMTVYLRLDAEAFDWLVSRNGKSRLGINEVAWRAVTIFGLHGYYKPGEDQHSIRNAMVMEHHASKQDPAPQGDHATDNQPTETNMTNSETVIDYEDSLSEVVARELEALVVDTEQGGSAMELDNASLTDSILYSDNLSVTSTPKRESKELDTPTSNSPARRVFKNARRRLISGGYKSDVSSDHDSDHSTLDPATISLN